MVHSKVAPRTLRRGCGVRTRPGHLDGSRRATRRVRDRARLRAIGAVRGHSHLIGARLLGQPRLWPLRSSRHCLSRDPTDPRLLSSPGLPRRERQLLPSTVAPVLQKAQHRRPPLPRRHLRQRREARLRRHRRRHHRRSPPRALMARPRRLGVCSSSRRPSRWAAPPRTCRPHQTGLRSSRCVTAATCSHPTCRFSSRVPAKPRSRSGCPARDSPLRWQRSGVWLRCARRTSPCRTSPVRTTPRTSS